ncbi:MAG: hypothetical protein V3U87_13830 [Methylococcaceae bacterium]
MKSEVLETTEKLDIKISQIKFFMLDSDCFQSTQDWLAEIEEKIVVIDEIYFDIYDEGMSWNEAWSESGTDGQEIFDDIEELLCFDDEDNILFLDEITEQTIIPDLEQFLTAFRDKYLELIREINTLLSNISENIINDYDISLAFDSDSQPVRRIPRKLE